MTVDLDHRVYHDGYKERIEALITSKMKGEVAQVKEEKMPKKPAAKSMMEALRATAESLQRRHSISVLRFLPCFFRISPLSAKSYDRYMYTIRNMAHT